MNMQDYELIYGDCLDLMASMPDDCVDFLFTDLPYGTTNCRWETPIDLDQFRYEAKRVVRSGGCKALFAQTSFDSAPFPSMVVVFRSRKEVQP